MTFLLKGRFHFVKGTIVATVFAVLGSLPVSIWSAPHDRINLAGATKDPRLTVEGAVSDRNVSELEISPDGTELAFVIDQSFLDSNDIRYALFVADSAYAWRPRKILELPDLSNVSWHGSKLSFLSSSLGAEQNLGDRCRRCLAAHRGL